jgi:hypothetical protein
MRMIISGSTQPPWPSKEEMEACLRFQGIIEEGDIQRMIAESEIWISEYSRKYPDDWKPSRESVNG